MDRGFNITLNTEALSIDRNSILTYKKEHQKKN